MSLYHDTAEQAEACLACNDPAEKRDKANVNPCRATHVRRGPRVLPDVEDRWEAIRRRDNVAAMIRQAERRKARLAREAEINSNLIDLLDFLDTL